MNPPFVSWILLSSLLFIASVEGAKAPAPNSHSVRIPAGIQHQSFDRLLKKYVDAQGLVAYGAWKANSPDVATLDAYLAQFAGRPAANLSRSEAAAGLANAYNAFAIRSVLRAYPVESLLATDHPLTGRHWSVGGKMVSLNDIEQSTLRPLIGWRTHAVLVCAARSCPPLRRDAYTPTDFSRQNEAAFRTWLARSDLNLFQPTQNKAAFSKVFQWFKKDFVAAGGIPKVIGPLVPTSSRTFIEQGKYEMKYLPYNFGLNDQGEHGRNYRTPNLVGDLMKNLL